MQRAVGIIHPRRHVLEDRVEQRTQIEPHAGSAGDGRRSPHLFHGPTVQGGGVYDREVELLLRRAEFVEEIERLVHDPLGSRAGTIDFVHDDDRLQSQRERLARDEPRLRHRPVHCIDEQQDAVDHREHALDLAAEVGVSRRVHDVDVRAVIGHRAVFRENRDPALTLEIVRIHDALDEVLMGRERARLPQQLVDERRLAVVDVGDDRDVAKGARHGG